MKNRFILAFAAITVMLTVLTACKNEHSAKKVNAPVSKSVTTIAVSSGSPAEYSSAGSVVADHRVDITSRLSGYIRWIGVHEGDCVKRGQVLVRLDSADVDGGIRQTAAGLKAAEAAYRDADTDRTRFQNLYERGSVSENELRKITLKNDASRETLNQAKAAYEIARSQRNYTEIVCPIDGTVVTRSKLVGDLALPGVPILTVESGQNLMFETSVDAGKRIPGLTTPGTPVKVQVEGIAAPLKGVVSRIVSSADPASRSFQLKIALPDTKGLIPGLYGKAVFNIGKTDLPTVPRQAVVERGGLLGVFVVGKENFARFRWIRTGREWADRVEVTAGLQAGEQLIMAPDMAIHDGDQVSVVKEVK